MKDIIGLLTLKRVSNLGDRTIKKLISITGSAEAVLKEKKNTLLKIPGIGLKKLADLHNPQHSLDVEKELAFIDRNGIRCQAYTDATYPELLKLCADSPVVLFSRGNIALENRKIISIVGTRKISAYGRNFCEQLLADLAPLNPIIISGMAYGVDICAQRAALNNGLQTIGCLAHGLNQMYPKKHAQYCAGIESNGGFFTDYWSCDSFSRKNFLGRNRIIAGLSEATIVIESAEKGGSLVTADIANSYNRDVFAVPGRIDDPVSKGCNTLIKTQRAYMLTGVEDLLYMLNWDLETGSKKTTIARSTDDLKETEKQLYDYLQAKGKTLLDTLAFDCEISTHETASMLLQLELKGFVKPMPGKTFVAL